MPYPHPETPSLRRTTADQTSTGDAHTALSQSLWGPWVLVRTRFVWALWASLAGMGFDSKRDFTPPSVLLGLLLCPWMCGISSQALQHLPSYWGFSNLGHAVSPHSRSSEVQPPLLTLDVGYLLMAARFSTAMQIQKILKKKQQKTMKAISTIFSTRWTFRNVLGCKLMEYLKTYVTARNSWLQNHRS